MYRIYLLIVAGLFAASSADADNWDLGQNSLTAGIGEVDWTIDPKFHGTKLLLGGRYSFDREAATRFEPPDAEILKYRIDVSDFQVGDSDTNLEYVFAGFTYWTYQHKKDDIEAGVLSTERTQLELLQVNASFDDSLGVGYYYELNAGRIGRFWAYKRSPNSDFRFTLGLNGSLGWAWASSKDPRYANVSNPTLGFWMLFIFEHQRWGQFYVDTRATTGFTFGEPKSTTAREANARFGIRRDFSEHIALDFFGEKRSFHYAAFDIPDLYTKARRIALELTYKY
jgi:hypothetical protein